jgi:GT2 family glycosyltransferase
MIASKPPLVYISVLNWNAGEKTVQCIKSIRQSDYCNYKIIVVDNNSKDNSLAFIREQYSDITILKSETNLGYAGGNKLALNLAIQDNADLFWILNNDSVVYPDALSKLVSSYIKTGGGIYGGVALTKLNDRFIFAYTIIPYNANIPMNEMPILDFSSLDEGLSELAVWYLQGSTLLIPISIATTYGFLDEQFFLYFEETDYCIRLHKQNIDSYLVLKSHIVHENEGSKSTHPEISYLIEYYKLRNKLIFFKRHRSKSDYNNLSKKLFKSIVKEYLTWFNVQFQQKHLFPLPSPLKFKTYAYLHGILGIMGKTFAPEDYI